jgi:hypothetical protein
VRLSDCECGCRRGRLLFRGLLQLERSFFLSAQVGGSRTGSCCLPLWSRGWFDSLPNDTARLGSARLGSARLGSARLGSARLGSARLGSAQLGSARLGSARLGSARLGSARLYARRRHLGPTSPSEVGKIRPRLPYGRRGRKNPTSPSLRKTRSCRRGRITEGEVVARSCPEMLFPVWSCHTMSPYRRNPRQPRGVINYFVLRCVSSWQPHAHVLPQILLVQL